MISSRPARVLTFLGGVAVIGILASLFTMGSSPVPPLAVGDLVPDLSLMGSDGERHSFRDLVAAGEALVIAWIPKTGTPG